MKKVNFYKKISLFHHADNSLNSHFHNFRSYCHAIWELKSDKNKIGTHPIFSLYHFKRRF